MDKNKKELNYLFAIHDDHDRNIVQCVGNTTDNFPFLCKGSNKLVTPFYLVQNNVRGATSSNNVVINGSEETPFATPSVPVELRNLRMPTVAINITRERHEKAIQYVPAMKDIPFQSKPDGGVVLFLPFIAFDSDAVYLHQNVFKGDTISIIGELKLTKVANLRNVPALWCNDVRKIRDAKRNVMQGEDVSTKAGEIQR